MMKVLAIFVSMLFSAVLFAQDASLLNYVPKDVDGFVYVNLQDILKNPKVKEMMDSSANKKGQEDFNELKKDLESNGVDIFTAFTAGVVYFRLKGASGGAVKTSINENIMIGIVEKLGKTKDKLKKYAHKGKTIYSIEGQKATPFQAPDNSNAPAATDSANETFFSYVSPDVVVISNVKDEIYKMMAMQDSSKVSGNIKLMNFSSKIDKASTAWGVFEYNAPEKKNPNGDAAPDFSQMLPYDNITGGSFAVMFSGEKKDSVNANIRLSCREKAKAQMLTVQIQAMVMMAIPNMARGNTQLSEELTKAFKFVNEENDISISFEFTPSIQEQIKKATEEMVKMHAGPVREINEKDSNPAAPAPTVKISEKPESNPKQPEASK
jgi:hypothetical protein